MDSIESTVFNVFKQDYMFAMGVGKGKYIKGFTFGKGKKLYRYCVPTRGGWKCYPIESDGSIGWPRYCHGSTKVTVHF